MYTQRELISEANPFTWMAQKQIIPQVGSGIKKGLSLAFNNPITRAASELQKAAMPGTGRTREQLSRMGRNIFRSKDNRNSRLYRKYAKYREENPPEKIVKVKKADTSTPTQEVTKTIKQENNIPVKTKIKGKLSQQFGIIDNDGNIMFIFYPFTVQKSNEPVSVIGNDTGFIIWDSSTGNQEIINQPLKTTEYVKDPNFISL